MPGTGLASSQVASLARAHTPQCPCPEYTPTVSSPSNTHSKARGPLPIGTPSPEGHPQAGLVDPEASLHPCPVRRFLSLRQEQPRAAHPPALRLDEGCPARAGRAAGRAESHWLQLTEGWGRVSRGSSFSCQSAANIARAFRIPKSWMFACQLHPLRVREPGLAPEEVNEAYSQVTRFCMWVPPGFLPQTLPRGPSRKRLSFSSCSNCSELEPASGS